MQTLNSVKKNRYKYHVGEHAWLVPEDNTAERVLVKIKKKLLRPFRESENYYLCEHCDLKYPVQKIHYESEL